MTKLEYNQLKAGIIRQFGKPEYNQYQPVNESAKKLVELKRSFLYEKKEVEKTKELVKEANQLVIPTNDAVVIPEEVLKDSWLTPFTDEQKQFVRNWITDISRNAKQLAEDTKLDIRAIRATMASEAFKLLRSHLAMAYKSLLPLEASAALRTLLRSKTDNVVLQAAKMILIDAGLYKGESLDITQNKPKEVLLDAETEEKLRKLGNQVMGVDGL